MNQWSISVKVSWCYLIAGVPWGWDHIGVPAPLQFSQGLCPERLPADQWDPQHLDTLPSCMVWLWGLCFPDRILSRLFQMFPVELIHLTCFPVKSIFMVASHCHLFQKKKKWLMSQLHMDIDTKQSQQDLARVLLWWLQPKVTEFCAGILKNSG